MGLVVKSCVCVLFLIINFDGVLSWNDGYQRDRHHQVSSTSRDWDTDWKLWARSQGWHYGDPVPEYDYTKTLSRRQLSPTHPDTMWTTQQRGPAVIPHGGSTVRITPSHKETGTMLVTRQTGSAVIPHTGSTVRVTPTHKESRTMLVTRQRGSAVIPNTELSVRVTPPHEPTQMLYKDGIRTTGTDWPKKRRGHRRPRLRHSRSDPHQQWQYSNDQPLTPSPRPRPCVRCPGDRAILATKGSTSVLMESPPIIPCHPWSSVDKVKSEILSGPRPGTKMAEGSHKIVLHLFRHKRTLATCVLRYNVIVRKCPEMTLSEGVKADCPLGKAWGSNCTLTCGPGYLLDGDSSTECSDDLEWSGVQPQCILSTACPVPVGPEHGHLSCRTPQHRPVSLQGLSMVPDGTVCHFKCQSGYMVPPEQSHLTRTRCIAGSWDSEQDPVCVETNEMIEEEEDVQTEISVEDALRLDGMDCPEAFCLNGGKCLTILGEPLCSCQPGYSGHQCEDESSSTETEDNTIT